MAATVNWPKKHKNDNNLAKTADTELKLNLLVAEGDTDTLRSTDFNI